MFGLRSLPYEVLSNIVGVIDFQDAFNLGCTCRYFEYLHREERICKAIVQTKIPYSIEALAAVKQGGGNARALRRIAKRYDALATASPFLVSTIGFCDAFIYCNGVLCYTLDDRVRILDLHRSGHKELVISIPGLLTQALAGIRNHSEGVFQILYYSDGIISCVYQSSDTNFAAWLIVLHLNNRHILAVHELDSTDKIFVRHNEKYVYYGTHSEIGADGCKKWVIHGYEYRKHKWFTEKVHLPDMVGSEVGSTICFEIHNEYFYALSNQTSFGVEEIVWTSSYHCVRFPINSPCRGLLEKTENKDMWRRQHQEGPIDDRWTSLSLDVDESTGDLKVVEVRKEWYLGASKSRRTYYTTEIVFPKDKGKASCVPGAAAADVSRALPSWIITPASGAAVVSIAPSSSSVTVSTPTATASARSLGPSASETTDEIDTSEYLNVPLLRLRRKDDHTSYLEAPDRQHQYTHPGDDGSTQPTYTLANTPIRTYHTSCSTFLDLVDDPNPLDWQSKQRLRLRAGTRKLGPPLTRSDGLLRKHSSHLPFALDEVYRVPPIAYWPEAQDPWSPDEELDAVYSLMNPPYHLGNVKGTADERSFVYVTGRVSEPQALIFLSFDPAIKLAGVKKWRRKKSVVDQGIGEGPHIDGRATGPIDDWQQHESEKGKEVTYVDANEANRAASIDTKGKEKDICSTNVSMVQVSSSATARRVEIGRTSTWAWQETAMYQDINLGFYFGGDQLPEMEAS